MFGEPDNTPYKPCDHAHDFVFNLHHCARCDPPLALNAAPGSNTPFGDARAQPTSQPQGLLMDFGTQSAQTLDPQTPASKPVGGVFGASTKRVPASSTPLSTMFEDRHTPTVPTVRPTSASERLGSNGFTMKTQPAKNKPSRCDSDLFCSCGPDGHCVAPGRDHSKTVVPDVRGADTEIFELGDDISRVTVREHDTQKAFSIHTSVLAKRSPGIAYLSGKLEVKGDFHIYDIEPEVFALYAQHLYTERLPSKSTSSEVGLDNHVRDFNRLCKLFGLATTMRDNKAAKDALTAIYTKAHEQPVEGHPMLPSSAHVNVIYKATDGRSGARKLMVDLHVWKAASLWIKQQIENGQSYPAEFLTDLALALLERQVDFSRLVKMEKHVSEYHDGI